MSNAFYSVLAPAYNEEEMLPCFVEHIIPVMEALGRPFEIIIVNDGSRDGTEDALRKACEGDKRVKGISLSRNFGQQAALFAGLKACTGQAVIVMDIDLQDPPGVIPEMTRMHADGYDVVHAKRKSRPGDGFFKKRTAALFYKFVGKISSPQMPDNVGDFKLYSRRAVDTILALPEKNRYLKGQSVWIGFKQGFVEFTRPKREKGETKYTFKKLARLAVDGIVSTSNYPLTLSGKIACGLTAASAVAFLTFIVLAACGIALPLAAWLFPFAALLVGIDLFAKAASDIYLSKIYDETRNRPVYIVKDTFNVDE